MELIPITDDEYRRLCLRAFENLPSDTAVTMDDVDAILTWCLPEYDNLRGRESTAMLRSGSRRTDETAHGVIAD